MALGSQPLGVSHPHSTSQNSQPTFPTYFPGGVGLALHGPALLAQPFAAACASAADCASAALASACARRSAASALADALSAKNSAASMAEADRSSSYGRAHGVRGSGFGIRREEGGEGFETLVSLSALGACGCAGIVLLGGWWFIRASFVCGAAGDRMPVGQQREGQPDRDSQGAVHGKPLSVVHPRGGRTGGAHRRGGCKDARMRCFAIT